MITRAKLNPESQLIAAALQQRAALDAQTVGGISPLGVHFADGVYSESDWFGPYTTNYAGILRVLNPAWVNILGGAQYNEARQRAEWVTANLSARVIFRHYKHIPPGQEKPSDGGLWKLPALEWVNNIGLAHGYPATGWYILTDNEPDMADWTPYVAWLCELIPLAMAAGLRLAVLRFSTHNPSYAQIDSGVFDPALRMIAQYQGTPTDPRIVVSPNWYYSASNYDGVSHIAALANRIYQVAAARPLVVIGEYAYAHNLDPNVGYLKAGISEDNALDNLLRLYREFAQPRGFRALAYCAGTLGGEQVTTFHMSKEMLLKMAEQAPVIPAETEPETTEFGPYYDAILKESTNLRADHTTSAALIVTVKADTLVQVYEPVTPVQSNGYSWYKVVVPDTPYSGWMALHRADLFNPAPPVEEEPTPPKDEDPTPPVVTPPDGDGTPTLTDADWARIEEIITRVIDARLGPPLRILSVLMAGYMSDRENDTRNFNNLVTEVQKEIETLFPDSKEAA